MSESGQIDIRFNEDRQRYEAQLGEGSQVAFLSVRRSPGLWELPSTVVPQEFSGKGVGSVLVKHVLAEARTQGVMVAPQCPFISAWIKRHDRDADLVHPDHLHLLER